MFEHISVEDGKYTVVLGDDGSLKLLRYGEPWQDLTGNKLIYCLAAELRDARNDAAAKQARIDQLMLEYCPGEMTAEQLAEWGEHQVPARPDIVPIPANADQAAGMALVGEAWLREHAPQRLKPKIESEITTLPGWAPLQDAPLGRRVLLGPRHAPVVGVVTEYETETGPERFCTLLHYNGNAFVSGYHADEWHPLPDTVPHTKVQVNGPLYKPDEYIFAGYLYKWPVPGGGANWVFSLNADMPMQKMPVYTKGGPK